MNVQYQLLKNMGIKEDNLDFVDSDGRENEEFDEEAFSDKWVRIALNNKSEENEQCHPSQLECI